MKLIQRWIKALRSGDYKQVSGRLTYKRESYCCLGVLCNIYNAKRWDGENYLLIDEFYEYGNRYRLPSDIQKKLNMNNTEVDKLMQMNDTGRTFAEIADYLEKNYTN